MFSHTLTILSEYLQFIAISSGQRTRLKNLVWFEKEMPQISCNLFLKNDFEKNAIKVFADILIEIWSLLDKNLSGPKKGPFFASIFGQKQKMENFA